MKILALRIFCITCIICITWITCISWITRIICITCITCITSITRITCIMCKTCITFTTCITYIMDITCITCITWIILFAEYLKKYVLVTLLKRWISVSHAKLCVREMLAHLKISVGVSSVGNNADAQIVQAVWLDRMSVDAPLLFVPIYSCWRTPTDVPFPNLSLKTWK